MPAEATRCVVVAGVSGSGKTTFARALAAHLGWAFVEGDDLHPASNVAKMSAGHALTDRDREPWLAAVSGRIDEITADDGLVITCSALRRAYRDRLSEGRPWLVFCLAEAPSELIAERLRTRTGHYMPASLLASQLATLEPLAPDEPGMVIDTSLSVEENVRKAGARFGS